MATGTTEVRDKLVSYVESNPGKYFTIDEAAAQLKLLRDSVGGSFYSLMKRAAVTRRRRSGSTAYEYAAGDPMAIKRMKEKAGKRLFPKHRKTAVPYNSSKVLAKILISFGGADHAVSLEDARAIWQSLDILFGK